jgi:Zn-dependent peptidase ImmA (M78 family)
MMQGSIESNISRLLRDNQIRQPPIPVERIAQALGATIRSLPLRESEVSGMLYRDGDIRVIGVNSLHHPHRRRFTIAHEIGHLLLHKGEQVHIDRSFRVNLRDDRSALGTQREEIQANLFAASLLMPREFLMADLKEGIDFEADADLKRLAERYQVSAQALTLRVNRLLALEPGRLR